MTGGRVGTHIGMNRKRKATVGCSVGVDGRESARPPRNPTGLQSVKPVGPALLVDASPSLGDWDLYAA